MFYILCIGVDGKLHECLPESSMCKCGMKVKFKKLSSKDYERLSGYGCTF
jgi:hypothetical protein